MIVSHVHKKLQNELFSLIHPHCFHTHAETPEIHILESEHTQNCFQFHVNEYKYLQCILKKISNIDEVHTIL